jgi:hypothetical protein
MGFRLAKTGKSYSDQKDIPLPGQGDLESDSLPEGYRVKYPDAQATRQELEEIVARVHGEGYVLLWSTVLRDLIAFYRDAEARSKIPSGFVPYSEAELEELFGDNKPPLPTSTLRLIHEAKKHGGHVINSERKGNSLEDDKR